jgi:hypothetical protein
MASPIYSVDRISSYVDYGDRLAVWRTRSRSRDMGKRDTALTRIVAAVESISGLRVPIAPRVLACLLGRQLHPVIEARHMRAFNPRSRRLVWDAIAASTPAAQHSAIARGCVVYILHHYGAAGAGVSAAELARVLCGRY